MILCPYKVEGICLIATRLSNLEVEPSPEECVACSKAFTPYSVNAVTCSMARNKQVDVGLVPNHSLLDCIYGEFNGPGTELGSLIKKWVEPTEDCGCDEKIAVMNGWGVEGCRENFDTIIGWLMDSYKKTNFQTSLHVKILSQLVPIWLVKRYVKYLVRRAIKNAEHRQMLTRDKADRDSQLWVQ